MGKGKRKSSRPKSSSSPSRSSPPPPPAPLPTPSPPQSPVPVPSSSPSSPSHPLRPPPVPSLTSPPDSQSPLLELKSQSPGPKNTVSEVQPPLTSALIMNNNLETKSLESTRLGKNVLLDTAAKAKNTDGDFQNPGAKKSWAECVKGTSGRMKKKGNSYVLDSGELCVDIPNEVITNNNKRWESFVMGQFHGKTPTPGALHAIFNGIWSNKLRDITASKFGDRTVLIRIPNPETRKRVINQGIWHIEGQTMFVAKWLPGLNPSMPELTRIPVWLEFRGVPPHFFSEEGFEHIAGLLGEPLHCHQSTVNMTNLEVGRVFTVINPLIPLPEAVNVKFESGEIHRVKVSSPWLPPICSHCSEVGHTIRRCPTAPITCNVCDSTSHISSTCPKTKPVARTRSEQIGKEKRPDLLKVWEVKQPGKGGKAGLNADSKRSDHQSNIPSSSRQPHVKDPDLEQALQVKDPVSVPLLPTPPVIDHISVPLLPVSDAELALSPPLKTYQRSKKGKKTAIRLNWTKEMRSDENKDVKSDTSVSAPSTDYTSDDVSDTGDESITPFTRVMSKKERSFERTNQGTRPKSNRRVR